jgi:hypothetical protein
MRELLGTSGLTVLVISHSVALLGGRGFGRGSSLLYLMIVIGNTHPTLYHSYHDLLYCLYILQICLFPFDIFE